MHLNSVADQNKNNNKQFGKMNWTLYSATDNKKHTLWITLKKGGKSPVKKIKIIHN